MDALLPGTRGRRTRVPPRAAAALGTPDTPLSHESRAREYYIYEDRRGQMQKHSESLNV